jgi:hypothetical protein
MRWLALLACAGLSLAVNPAPARAGGWTYGGHQPWWNIFAKRHGGLTSEEERLQRFWHDYYDALGRYYKQLDHIDWVAYYKNHGYQISPQAGCGPSGCKRIQFAPVFVSPQMQWAIPSSCLNGPPASPPPGHVAFKVPAEAKAEVRPPAPRKAPAEGGRTKAPPQGAPPDNLKLFKADPQSRIPDHFELFLERILEAPRGQAPKASAAQALPTKGDAPPRPGTADDSRPFGERLLEMLRGQAPKAPPQSGAATDDLHLQAALRLRGQAPQAPAAQAPPPPTGAAPHPCVR